MMNECLSHIESHITSEEAEIPITDYLNRFHFIADDSRLPQYIPNTVFLQHYVEFRVVLRRYLLKSLFYSLIIFIHTIV